MGGQTFIFKDFYWYPRAANVKLHTLNLPGESPPEIGELTLRRALDVRYTDISELPPETGQLSNLRQLHLSRTPLEELAPEIGNVESLTGLDVSYTHIREFPPELGELNTLVWLKASNIPLDRLPPEIGDLAYTNVQELPAEMANLCNFEYLYLAGTSATLPPEVEELCAEIQCYR